MIQTEEQIFIITSINHTQKKDISKVINAISAYNSPKYFVRSVILKTYIFNIPSGNIAGATLSSELNAQMKKSIGAIIFIDDLRPNVAYEFGFFHGQGKPFLLITNKDEIDTWMWISDLAGTSLLNITKKSIKKGIHEFLNLAYNKFSEIDALPAPEIPLSNNNMLLRLGDHSHEEFNPKFIMKDFGEALTINTWGGFLFSPYYKIQSTAKFKIVLRSIDNNTNYSIYFRIRYIDSNNEIRQILLGLSSNIRTISFEANERNIPSQAISRNWCIINNSFENLLKAGLILGENKIECIENIRFRAGNYKSGADAIHPAYEIGYFEIIGMDR